MDTDKAQLDKLSKINFAGVKLVDVVDKHDGTAQIVLDISKEFRKKYMQAFQLKRWSQKHFTETVIESMNSFLDDRLNRQVQNPDFLWTQPEANNE